MEVEEWVLGNRRGRGEISASRGGKLMTPIWECLGKRSEEGEFSSKNLTAIIKCGAKSEKQMPVKHKSEIMDS